MEPLENNNEALPPEPAESPWKGLSVRAVSALAMAVPFLAALWLGGWWFTLAVTAAALQMIREWDGLTVQEGLGWKLGGLLYVALPCASLVWLRELIAADTHEAGLKLVLYVMLVVWTTDIGAYFAGKRIGGRKLAPAISPGKTWAGLGGGMASATVIGGLCTVFTPYPASLAGCMGLAALLAVVAQSGDLYESWLKRRAGAKDSGALIPGHGGLLDRVDGLMFAVPLYAFLAYLSGSFA
jgi:phosphatidate cytidylyltransferase